MKFTMTRRTLLKGALMSPAVSLPIVFSQNGSSKTPTNNPDVHHYFTAAEFDFIDAAVERLIPADSLGPGAKEAGVASFIDRQLSGSYGRAETWYMRGPWEKGTKEQGYQLRLNPAQLYRAAIRDIDAYCQHTYGNKNFAQLDAGTRDQVLTGLEKDEIKLANVPAKQFFEMLVQNTTEGFLADPMYGGNRDFIGWKLIGFPGPRYNYAKEIEQYGKRYAMPTVGILGRDGKAVAKA